MTKISICNAYIPNSLETEHYRFEPIENFRSEYKAWEKSNKFLRNENLITAYAFEKLKNKDIPKSFFYPAQPKVWDYCIILSLFQARNIFPYARKNAQLFFRQGRSYDWQILTSDETAKYLISAIDALTNFSDRQRYVFLKTLVLLFEGELFTHFSDFKDVWYLQSLELFSRGIYCIDNNINDPKIATSQSGGRMSFKSYLEYSVRKFGYDSDYGNKKSIDPFLQEIVDVRNWVMHGKTWTCNVYTTRAEEILFFHRVEALLKAFLLDYLNINVFTNRAALIHGIAYGNQAHAMWIKR